MVRAVGQTTFAEGFDETSFLFVGVALLLSLLAAQIIWAQYNRSSTANRTETERRREAESAEAGGSGGQEYQIPDTEALKPEDYDFEGEAVRCPECSKPTEAEYRFCRHCAGDIGKSYVGSRGDDGSSSSGMF